MPWLKQHNPTICFTSHTITFDSKYCRRHYNIPRKPIKLKVLQDVPKTAQTYRPLSCPNILKKYKPYQVTLRAAATYTYKEGYCLFTASLEQIDNILKAQHLDPARKKPKPAKTLPKKLEKFTNIFSPKKAKKLPPHHLYNHHI